MTFIKRLSDTFWGYVSPQKPTASLPTPHTEPRNKRPLPQLRRASLQTNTRTHRSLSPASRVNSWRLTSPSKNPSNPVTRKRPFPSTPSTDADAGRRKVRKMDFDDVRMADFTYDDDSEVEEGDTSEEEYDSEQEQGSESEVDRMEDDAHEHEQHKHEAMEGLEYDRQLPHRMSRIRVSHSPKHEDSSDEDIYQDDTEVVDEADYERSTTPRKIVSQPRALEDHGVTAEELRAKGWDDDHITLKQRLVLRGREAIMPKDWQWTFRQVPDTLFASENDKTSLSPENGSLSHGAKALYILLGLGADARMLMKETPSKRTPEVRIRKYLQDYTKWALVRDAKLDKKRMIPLVAVVAMPPGTPDHVLGEAARRKLAKIASKYKKAFSVVQSTENSPSSRASTQLSYPIPTLYALVASSTIVALCAYKPMDRRPEVVPVAMFDYRDADYDVWNSLAMAIVINHARDVMLRIADDTGLGARMPGEEEEVYDPDR